MATLDPNEIMFTPFEPKVKNRFIMYIEGIPAYLIRAMNRPQLEFEEIVLDHINVKRYIKGKKSLAANRDNFIRPNRPIRWSGKGIRMDKIRT